jgi:hypothetical protein
MNIFSYNCAKGRCSEDHKNLYKPRNLEPLNVSNYHAVKNYKEKKKKSYWDTAH